jgi:hypothetical protein
LANTAQARCSVKPTRLTLRCLSWFNSFETTNERFAATNDFFTGNNKQFNFVRRISSQNSFRLRGRLFNLIAVLLLLYTVADVSILEFYCGNENLGIPSYSQTIASPHQSNQETETSLIANASGRSSSAPERETPESPVPSHECICSCGHVLVASYHFEPHLLPLSYRQQYNFYLRSRHSESHLAATFRPPRLA